jgi:Tol biopolymer transport system component/DNA-binding winged helix-turn-helix (wHTH) protein
MPRSVGSKQATEAARPAAVAHARRVVRFGVFEVDLAGEQLRKNGLQVTLPRQPFQILTRLIERPGEVVTREELRRTLWADTIHVDFDHCLNTAVNKLREVLNDSAENPRFVQTIPRRGYRFVAPVVHVGVSQVPPVPPRPELPPAPFSAPAPPESPLSRRRWKLLLVGTAIALIASVATWVFAKGGARSGALLEPIALTRLPGSEVTPAFSPDGRQVAFAWNGATGGNFSLYTMSLDAGTPRRLTSSASDDFGPAYSPDGRQVAFYRRSGDSGGLYVASAAGGAVQRLGGLDFGPPEPLAALTGGPADLPLQSVSWSPDAKYLAFVDKSTMAGPFGVFVWSMERGQKVRLTWPPSGSLGDGSPVFSPSGAKLAFVRYEETLVGSIYLVSLPDGNPTRLTSDTQGIRGLAWTPDGRRLVFATGPGGQPTLWKVAASGGDPERLAGVSESAVSPAIPVHRRSLVYMRWTDDTDIWRVPLAPSPGRAASKLVSLPGADAHPRYSPDGRRIVFTSDRSGYREIWVCGAGGENPASLTSLKTYSGSPRWSPDGRHIAFDARTEGNWEIYVIAAEGGTPRRLASHTSEDSRPSWSSDGRWIYFRSDRSGTTQIWKVPAQGGEPVQVTTKGGYEAVESPDGRVLYYVRRGLPGLWTVPVEGGEESLVTEELRENLRNWIPTREGIYFIERDREASRSRFVLRLFRFDTRRIERVASLGAVRARESGCSVSHDGRWLILAGSDETETDLALLRELP